MKLIEDQRKFEKIVVPAHPEGKQRRRGWNRLGIILKIPLRKRIFQDDPVWSIFSLILRAVYKFHETLSTT